MATNTFPGRHCKVILATIALALLASSCIALQTPKSIILLIGDGMGIGHITTARCAGPGPSGKLAIDTMPVTGLSMTYPANAIVTDSAAAGTALATGVKAKNGAISVDPSGKRVRTLLEAARDMGKSTGIISTKFITDATPAVFVAHAASRKQREDIAAQMIASRVNVVLGGGRRDFLPDSAGGARKDGRDLLADAAKRGYDVFDSADAMAKSTSDRMIGLFASDVMSTERPEPTIAEMTAKAISTLAANPKGFFLMSEGAQIDSKAHGNDMDGVIRQMSMFDEAVRVALDVAAKSGDTLVIVTADHDTGGMAAQDPNDKNPKVTAGWVSGGHSANMVPIYAYGPGADLFTGTHQNTDIPKICAQLWGQKLN